MEVEEKQKTDKEDIVDDGEMNQEEDPSTPENGKRDDTLSETGGKFEEEEVVEEEDKTNEVKDQDDSKVRLHANFI